MSSGSSLPVSRIGDAMTHGAVLVQGSPTQTVDGIPMVRIGDMCICPIKGHGANPIVSGCSPTVSDNSLMVSRIGATAHCGAQVIQGSPTKSIA